MLHLESFESCLFIVLQSGQVVNAGQKAAFRENPMKMEEKHCIFRPPFAIIKYIGRDCHEEKAGNRKAPCVDRPGTRRDLRGSDSPFRLLFRFLLLKNP
jgi:hypothetical protein